MSVHGGHCCVRHGCKYGDDGDCAVMSGTECQEFPCELCGTHHQTSWALYNPKTGEFLDDRQFRGDARASHGDVRVRIFDTGAAAAAYQRAHPGEAFDGFRVVRVSVTLEINGDGA